MENLSPIMLGFLGSLAAGSLTAVGAAPVLFGRIPSRATRDLSLGFAAGVMLSASFFSLIIPALDAAEPMFENGAMPAAIVCVSILLGMGAVALMNEKLPHEHFKTGREGPEAASLRRVWLFIIAITLHDLPEGMAVGVGFATGDPGNGAGLAVGIGLQNIPEGLAVAVSLLAIGYSRKAAFGWGALTGAAEPLGGLIGAAAGSLAELALPAVLGAAAGAMLYIISDEIIPETHRRGFETPATFALMTGMVVMMFLDTTLG